MSKMKIVFLIIVVIFVLIFFSFRSNEEIVENLSNVPTDTSPLTNDPGYKIESVPIDEDTLPSLKMPDLNKKITFSTSLTKEAVDILNGNISKLREELLKNPKSFDNWVLLGNNYKIAGDLEGAREVWEYASSYKSFQPVPHLNLADLYAYYLGDKVKAENHFLKSLEILPKEPSVYIRTADFYKDILGDLSKAKKVLERGLSVNPGELALKNKLEDIKSLVEERKLAPKPL